MRTRVGYAGGTSEDPSYRLIGDHSESIQIDYDPSVITYQELLTYFWDGHTPTSPPFSQQYASIIFYHDDEQKTLALSSKERQEEQCGCEIFTEIVPANEFYLAEDYHQKYRLRQSLELMSEFESIYPNDDDFLNSTAVARVNGYLAGYATLENLKGEIDELGLSLDAQQKLLSILQRNQ